MSLYGMSAVAIVAVAALVALMAVLRHLAALHLTKTQASELRFGIDNWARAIGEDIHRVTKDLEDTKAKLSALSNRVR